jgi:uncharacterized protein (DUF58 family)
MGKAVRLAVGLLILLVLAMVTGFQPLYWLAYLILGGAVISYAWAWVQSRGLDTGVQELTRYPQVGESVELKVTVREKVGLPRVGLRARLVSDFATMAEDDFGLAPRGTTSWTVSALCRRRGLNSVGPLAIFSGDPTGLLSLECRIGEASSVLVYPHTIELSRVVVEGQTAGGELGEIGLLKGHSPVASMVREHAPGEGQARIHWPTTARLGRLMTKEFEGAGVNEIWLWVDLQGSVHAGTGRESTEEYCITIAASLARSLVANGHAVGMVAQGDDYYRLSPRRDQDHLWTMLRALALVRATGTVPLSTIISQETAKLGSETVAIVIAPWSGQRVGTLFRFLIRRGVMVVPIFLDTPGFARSAPGRGAGRGGLEMEQWAFVVRRDDDLSRVLGQVLDRIATY